MYIIEHYETENGKCPIEDFLDSLEPKMKAKMLHIIELLERNGPMLRGIHSEHLGDGIFQLRAQQGSNITRVLYFFVSGRKIVLTNGFVKKEQKTPRSEIELAKKYREDYERRYGR